MAFFFLSLFATSIRRKEGNINNAFCFFLSSLFSLFFFLLPILCLFFLFSFLFVLSSIFLLPASDLRQSDIDEQGTRHFCCYLNPVFLYFLLPPLWTFSRLLSSLSFTFCYPTPPPSYPSSSFSHPPYLSLLSVSSCQPSFHTPHLFHSHSFHHSSFFSHLSSSFTNAQINISQSPLSQPNRYIPSPHLAIPPINKKAIIK